MYTQAWILCSIFIPAAAGLLFLVLPAKKMEEKKMSWAAVAALALTAVSVALLLVSYGRGSGAELTLLTPDRGPGHHLPAGSPGRLFSWGSLPWSGCWAASFR